MPLAPGFQDGSPQPESSVTSIAELALSDPQLAGQLSTTPLQHYPYPKDTDPEKRLAFIQGVIDTTFGYVGRQEHALQAATSPDGELRQTFEYYSVDAAITHFTSHDNGVYSYMAAWVNRAVAAESPDWQDDLRLLVATRAGYSDLDLRVLHGIWSGDLDAAAQGSPPQALDEATVRNYFARQAAQPNGLLSSAYDADSSELVAGFKMWPSVEDASELLNLIHNGGLASMDNNSAWIELVAAAPYSPVFQAMTRQLAVRKLGCGLAVFQQAMYESEALGKPVPLTYKPAGDRWEESWMDGYNEPLPTLAELQARAQATLTGMADPADTLLQHLIAR